MQLKQSFILLKSAPYRIVDEKTGEVNEGISLRYIPVENLNPVVDSSNADLKGVGTAKASLPTSFLNKIKQVPALYSFDMSMNVGADGKPVMKVNDVEFLSILTVSATKSA